MKEKLEKLKIQNRCPKCHVRIGYQYLESDHCYRCLICGYRDYLKNKEGKING